MLPGLGEWEAGLSALGVDTEARGDVELAVAATAAAEEAAATGARALLLEARPRELPPGWKARAFLPLPSLDRPSLIVPLDRANVASYALETWLFPSTWPRLARKKALVPLARPALALLPRPRIVIATRDGAQPLLVRSAVDRFGLDAEPDWFVVCGQGDELSRGLFVLFAPGARRPSWVVKFSRVPGYHEPFDRDEAGLELVARAGSAAAARAPRLVGRFDVEGHEASVETAAVGSRLNGVLGARGTRRRKLRLVEEVAEWLVQVALETQAGPGSAAREAQRLARDVLPRWTDVPPDVLDGVEALPAVLVHHDLGGWNVVVDRGGFTVVDWESARADGLPLWDLWYFLAHALPQLDAPSDDPAAAFVRLFRGESPSSPVLFRWTRAAAASLAVPPALVGRLATLCWLHHGLSRSDRAETLARHASGSAAATWPASRFAEAWLGDPQLGPGWSRWQER